MFALYVEFYCFHFIQEFLSSFDCVLNVLILNESNVDDFFRLNKKVKLGFRGKQIKNNAADDQDEQGKMFMIYVAVAVVSVVSGAVLL